MVIDPKTFIKRASILMLVLFCSGCATYYQVNEDFNAHFEQGQLELANKVLNQKKKQAKKKARFLYFANKGVVESMLGNYDTSNYWFERAYIFGEDYKKKAGNVAASFLVNPNTIIYPGEDHEHLLLLYYKAINYLKLGDAEAALVECRRLNNRLSELSDKYRSDNKYREDAFIHNLMGIIYDANKDYNNAFIAYRNALEIYQGVYLEMFGVDVPDQLKKDLIRTASLMGFKQEEEFYRNEFWMNDYTFDNPEAELVFFWHNGLGPVKDEWSANFTTGGFAGGFYTFTDQNGNVHTVACTQAQANQLSDLSFVRIAIPTYLERPPIFDQGSLTTNSMEYNLELAENVNLIAKKTLDERMAGEIGKAILRLAIKKVVENQVSKEDQTIGFLVSIFNAASEKADTRNWQTVPYAIHYARVPLTEGENKVELRMSGLDGTNTEQFSFDARSGETVFHTYQSLESLPLGN